MDNTANGPCDTHCTEDDNDYSERIAETPQSTGIEAVRTNPMVEQLEYLEICELLGAVAATSVRADLCDLVRLF